MSAIAKVVLVTAAASFAIGGLRSVAGASAVPFTLDNIYSEVRLSAPCLSPDGKHVVLTVSRAIVSENRYADSIVLIDTTTGAQRELVGTDRSDVTDAPDGDLADGTTKVSNVTWSPSGDRVAWLTQIDGKAQPDIMVWSIDAPQQRPTAIPTGVADASSFRWSPDGRWIALAAQDPAPPRTGAARFDKSFEVFDIGQSAFEMSGIPAQTRLWVVPSKGGAATALTGDDENVRDFAWALDSTSIIYHSEPNATQTASRRGSLRSVAVPAGAKTEFVPEPAKISDGVQLSTRGVIAYRHFTGVDPWTHTVRVATLVDGKVRETTAAFDHSILQFDWLPDGRRMVVLAHDGLRGRLWVLNAGGRAQPLDLGEVNASDMSVGRSGAIAFIGDTAKEPAELYVMASWNAQPKRLTHYNDALAALAQGRVEPVGWRSDGMDNEGTLTYPPDFVAGRRYPLLVGIHGGPEAATLESFNAQSQYLAAQGWLVFQPNYRGSNNMGEAYQTAIIGVPTDGPVRDILAGIKAVEAKGAVDERRVAVTGYSYGGVLTAALITHDDFCAAIPREFVTDWRDYYNLSESAIWLDGILGSPWKSENRQKYDAASLVPLIPRVKTPTLMLQNAGDQNAEATDVYTFFHGLKENGVNARLIVFGVPGHSADLSRRRADLRYILEWVGENCRAPN